LKRRLFKNRLIFDGLHPGLLADRFIVVEGDSIAAILDAAPDGPFDEIVDLNSATLPPGFIDAHFHAYIVDLDFVRTGKSVKVRWKTDANERSQSPSNRRNRRFNPRNALNPRSNVAIS